MSKKLIAFDLDGTLAPSKSHFEPRMVTLFNQLLKRYEVCVISGAKYELFQQQFLSQISTNPADLERLHLLPTTGTRYYRFQDDEWTLQYADDFTDEQKANILHALQKGLDESDHKSEETYGPVIEDRHSQITLSPLGQEVVAELGEDGIKLKESWDPDGKKRLEMVKTIQPLIPDLNVRVAGATSIDVTMPGIDKGYGMSKLLTLNNLRKEDVLFFGDKIFPGGNDYAVKEFGIDCIPVESWEDTANGIERLLNES